MATLLQGSTPYLQGSGNPLQGSTGYLQGGQNAVQNPLPKPVTAPAKPAAYGTPGATSPAKQAYVNDLSSRYGLNNGTVYDKSNNTGFSDANAFYKSAGVNSFDGIKFDTAYQPTNMANPTGLNPATAFGGQQQSQANQPVADPMSPFKTAYQKYVDTLAPSKEVTDARTKYANFIESRDKGLQAINDKVIPMGFITGQRASLANQAEIQGNRLQSDIEIAQGDQAARSASAQANLAMQQDLSARGAQMIKDTAPALLAEFENLGSKAKQDAYVRSKANELGVTIDQVNSALQAAIKAKQQEPLTLSEGEAVYDPVTGQMVFKNPKTYDPTNGGANSLGAFNLTSGQSNLLNGIINKYNASPLRQAVNRLPVLESAIDSIRKNPSDGAQQLNLSYAYIQALDTYQSAVREGELGIVNSIDSKVGQFSNYISQMQNGQIVRPEVAKQTTDAAKNIVDTIRSAAQNNQQSYASQASVFGLGDVWNAYIGGGGASNPGGGGSPDDIINRYLQGFKSVGNTSGSTPYLQTLGAITGENGSSLWAPGLDIDLKVGDPVRTPVSGIVIAAKPNGGFGNQVKIRDGNGNEYWLSHLQKGTVKVGQQVRKGQVIGLGGNSGSTIPGKGGDGSHLDLTVKANNGKLLTAQQVKGILQQIYV